MRSTVKLYAVLVYVFIANIHLPAQNYSDTINHVFEHVDINRITTGLLSDYGVQVVDLEAFNGVPADSNYVDMDTWKKLYAGIYTSIINSNVSLELPDDVNYIIDNVESSPIQLVMMHYSYNKLNDDAVTLGLLQVINNQIYDVPGAASPYLTRQLFAVAPKSIEFNSRTVSFVFNSDLWFSNAGKSIQNIEINFNNESGYLTANWNTPISYTFTGNGVKTIYFRLTYTDGSNYTSQTNIGVKSPMQQAPGSLPTLISIPSTSEHSGGTLQIIYASSNNTNPKKLRKTLIVAEGYDVSSIIPSLSNMDISDFTRYSTSTTSSGTIDIPYTSTSYMTLLDELDYNKFDIVYVDNNNGVDDIRRNAKLFEAAIDIVNNLKEKNQINVVMGISMGGLVARYALRDMELRNKEHNAIKFITIDSPHKGANVPVGAQAAVRQLQPSVPLVYVIEAIIQKTILDDNIKGVFKLLSSAGTKQLLIYNVSPNFTFDNTVHDAFMNEIETMGFPRKCQVMAITNGSGNKTENYAPESNILSYNVNLLQLGADALNKLLASLMSSVSNFNMPVLNLIKPKSELGVSIAVNALPDKNVKSVYTAKIYIKKKILWLIPLKIDLYTKTLNSTADMVAIDGAPGGDI